MLNKVMHEGQAARQISDPARILVSIVNWNGGEEILMCLRSLFESDYRSFSVIVIDNASTDGSAEGIEGMFPEVELIRNSVNAGFTGGQNQAVRIAGERGFEFLFLLNGDTLLPADALGLLVAELDMYPDAAMVAPVIRDAENYPAIQFCGGSIDWEARTFHHWESVELALAAQEAEPANFFLWGTALMVRRSVLEKIGVLDELFFAYYEDLDLCVRASRAGFAVRLVPAVEIRHRGSNDWTKRATPYVYYHVRNRALFWTKHLRWRGRLEFWRQWLAAALITAGDYREAGETEKANAVLLGAWDAILGRGGEMDLARQSPGWLRFVAIWHPYMAADVLRGRYAALLRRLLRRRGDRC